MCAGSGGSVSRDNMRFLVIGRAVWEPPQAREWAPDYVSVCAGARVVRPGRPPGSSPGHGFPKGSLNPGCLEEVRLCRCRRGEDFSGGGMSGLKFEFPIYQYQSIHDYG